jgi:hypothetical protein
MSGRRGFSREYLFLQAIYLVYFQEVIFLPEWLRFIRLLDIQVLSLYLSS